MRKIVLLLLLTVLPPVVYGQVAMQLNKSNTLYLCMSNELTIAVEGYSADRIIVTTNNGEIRKSEFYEMSYDILPSKPGLAMIFVSVKGKDGIVRLLDSSQYVVRRQPGSSASLTGFTNGKIAAPIIRAQTYLGGGAREGGCGNYQANGFTVRVYRDGRLLFKRKNTDGGRFDSEVRDFFNTLVVGDVLLFTDATQRDCDGGKMELSPATFVAN